MRRRGRHAGSPLVGGTPAGGPGTSAAHGPFRRHLALVLPVALALAVAAAAAATSVETASVEDQVTAVAADGDDVWVGRSVEGGRFRAGRFSAGGSLEREVLLALPDAELVGRWLLVDRRGRLWLNAWSEDGEGNLRTQAVAFTPRGRPSSRHDVTGWDPPRVSPQGEVFISKRSDEGGEEALIFARLDPQGIQPLFSLSRGEYFGPPADRGDQWLVTTPLAAGRFAVLRTWASDGWLSVYDASGRRHARWPFRVADGRLSGVALAPGPEGGVTIAYRTVLGAGEGLVRVESYRVGGERLHTAVLPADARLDLAADRSGGSWVPDGSGSLWRLSPAGTTIAAFATDPPPDGLSWAEAAALRRELARLAPNAPAERWLEALLDGDRATSRRAAAWFVARGTAALPVLLDELVHDGEVWPVIARVLASEPAAPALAVAHLAGAGRESRLAFARRLSDEAPRVEVVEEYRDLLEGLYLSGEDGRPAAGPALEALPISDRLFAHQMEQVLGFGASPYLLSDVIFERFGAVSAQLEAAFAGSPERRERSVAVVHCLLDWIVRRPPHEAPELERELRDRGRRWAVRPEPEVALAGGLLALATGEAVDLPRLLDEALAAEAERPAKQAILRRLRFEPDSLDEPAVAALLDVVHCRDCKHDRPLVGAIRAALGGEDFAQAHEDYTSLPLDEPLPGRVFAALTAEYPRFAAGELAAFLDDPRLRALPPSFSLARLLDGVHRFAADRPEVQRTVRDLFAAVFTPEAIRKGEAPEGAPGGVWKAHTNPRHGHWLGALEPAAVHGLMDEVPDDVVAAVEVPPDDAFVRRARAGWGLARFIETSGRRAPEHLREWSRSMWLDTPWSSHGPPEPPGLPGLLQRLDRMDAHRRWRWLAELDADSREVEAALLTRLDHPSAGTRAEARVLLAEMGSARGREVVLRELEASLATGEAPPAHLLAAAVLHGDDLPAAALDRAATAEPTFRNWPLDGLTPLAMDRLARHLRSRAWEETDARATGAVRLLAALRDELASHFLVELAAHHRSPPVAAAARAARASSF